MQLGSSPATAFGLIGSRWRPPVKGAWFFRDKNDAASGVALRPTSIRIKEKRAQATHVSCPKGLQNIGTENDTDVTKGHKETRDIDDHVISMVDAEADHLQPLVDQVRAMLRSMNDGEINVSAYDTAWVAMVPRLDGGEGPQFPTTVKWILDNQLPDGSWGDEALFSAYDRTINTLACVVALTKWSLGPEKCKTGLSFLHENMWRLAEEDPESMLIGFEIAFPSLIELSRSLGIDFPYDHPVLEGIYAAREVKLNRIPKDMMHRVPTSILFSIEGMPGLDWEKLLKLLSSNGSFLYSPSATAYALMETGEKRCFEYLNRIVNKFNGGAPNVYPVDLFEHTWAVDRLERLGISRYFKREIEHAMFYVNRHWIEEGICWGSGSMFTDVDVTAMAWRLLRLHGYNMSPSVFKNFEKDGEFFCILGQSTQAVTGMYNLNRASQISFPGEEILQRARNFSYNFLREREAQGTLQDKWIISKDLPAEVQYALDFPWYASLPRVEARTYLDHYGGKDDVWIGKVLYRMPFVNNDVYLELARQDFNHCQVVHQQEWRGLEKWFIESGLETFGLVLEDVLRAYFLAVSCIFEPSRSIERLAWVRVSMLANAIVAHIRSDISAKKRIEGFMCNRLYEENNDSSRAKRDAEEEILSKAFNQLIDLMGEEPLPNHYGQKPTKDLIIHVWIEWMAQLMEIQDDRYNKSGFMPRESFMVHNKQTFLLLVKIIEICAGRIGKSTFFMNNVDDDRFFQLSSSVSDSIHLKMLLCQDTEKNKGIISSIDEKIQMDMQKIAQCLLPSSDDIARENKTKQTLLNVVKTCYYAIHCPPHIVDRHISKVIFEPII